MAVLANVRIATCGHGPADGGGTSTDGDDAVAAVAKGCMACSPGADGNQSDATYCAGYSCTDKAKGLLSITEDEVKARKFCEGHGWKWDDDYGDAYRLIYEVIR